MTEPDEPLRISSRPTPLAKPGGAGAAAPLRPVHQSPETGHPPVPHVPPDPGGPTMPAGRVLGILVFGLLLASLLNADAVVRKAKGEGSPEWRITVAESVQSVSDALFLNEPRKAIDAALGKNQNTSNRSAAEIAADRGIPVTEDGGSTDTTSGESTATTVPPDTPPTLRAPTAEKPLRLWVGGDSLSETLSASVKSVFEPTGIFDITTDPRVSTGLTRPDYFNWPEHFANDVLPVDPTTKEEPPGFPEVMIVVFGANDSQNIEKDGEILERLTPEWLDEYRSRVAATMDLLRHKDDERIVLWVGQPIMGPGSKVKGMDQLDHIYWEEAAKRPWVVYFDSWPFFSDADGNYADQLPSADGTVSGMRQPDNVHFSTPGGNRLSWAMLERLGELIDLSAWKGEPDPSQAPPDDVEEREVVPPTAPGGDA